MVDEDVRETVKDLLLEESSADNPLTSREISNELEKNEVGSFPKTRMIIRDIMVTDGIPIVSSNQGYWVAESEQEIQDYIDNLENRIMGITERRYAIKRAAQMWDGDIETDDDLDIL